MTRWAHVPDEQSHRSVNVPGGSRKCCAVLHGHVKGTVQRGRRLVPGRLQFESWLDQSNHQSLRGHGMIKQVCQDYISYAGMWDRLEH